MCVEAFYWNKFIIKLKIMKRILPALDRINTTVHFPKKIENSDDGVCYFVSICSTFLFWKFFCFKKHLKVNWQNLIVVIKIISVSLEMEIRIAGKYFCEIKEGEIVYCHKKEDSFLNELTLEELNLDVKYNRVKKGKYSILFYDDRIKILFTLSK